MTEPARPMSAVRSVVSSPILLWAAFILVHLWLAAINLYGPGQPLGDVTNVYKFWTDQLVIAHFREGIDGPWVYPILAILPMLAARAFGPEFYAGTWLGIVMLLDAIAFGVITGWGKNRENTAVAWWWVVFLLLLGPIALGRIDSITAPIAIVGILLVATRPRVATVILTIATWIKVWPAALLAAILISVRGRVHVVTAAALTSAAIVAVALSLGAGTNVVSFVSQQTERGLQVEAPISTIWLWRAFAGVPDTVVYYDQAFLTWQLRGAGVDVAGVLMNPLMMLVVVAITLLALLAARNRVPAPDLLPTLSLAYVVALIAFNKVGSPQYITWLAIPVILGLATNAAGRGRSFRTPAIMVAVLAALTQLIYPYLYGYLLGLFPAMLLVITARNILYFVLLGWAIAGLWQASRSSRTWIRPDAADEAWLPSVWPFRADHVRLGEDEFTR
jgi:hypothetical protein